ncbi:MAG TPA: hypothetical protein VNM47_01320, partial [Terriglobia bacterium]|nr:hypothetical protein [Terriglobia bacterium]
LGPKERRRSAADVDRVNRRLKDLSGYPSRLVNLREPFNFGSERLTIPAINVLACYTGTEITEAAL